MAPAAADPLLLRASRNCGWAVGRPAPRSGAPPHQRQSVWEQQKRECCRRQNARIVGRRSPGRRERVAAPSRGPGRSGHKKKSGLWLRAQKRVTVDEEHAGSYKGTLGCLHLYTCQVVLQILGVHVGDSRDASRSAHINSA